MAARATPFRVAVGGLRKHAGQRREVAVAGEIAELANSGSEVVPGSEVAFAGAVESTLGGVVVAGTVTAEWQGECRRCLEPAAGTLTTEVRELCSDDPELATEYAVGPDFLDLEPVVHDACILELPLAPLCRDDCLGLCPGCGVNRNRAACTCSTAIDPRWAALEGLGSTE